MLKNLEQKLSKWETESFRRKLTPCLASINLNPAQSNTKNPLKSQSLNFIFTKTILLTLILSRIRWLYDFLFCETFQTSASISSHHKTSKKLNFKSYNNRKMSHFSETGQFQFFSLKKRNKRRTKHLHQGLLCYKLLAPLLWHHLWMGSLTDFDIAK